MEKIVVGDVISSSCSYIADIRKAGFEPIMLETYNDDGGREQRIREANYKYIDQPLPRIIKASKHYEETLEMVKKENPLLVIPGSELSVVTMNSLAHDLGLPGNNPVNFPQMTLKHKMQEACKNAGLRYIKGQMISNINEALNFWEENEKRRVVLKPTHGVNSSGVHICSNEEEIINGFNNLFGTNDVFGGKNNKVLIQEYIDGTEYIVNTVSCEGENYVSSVYRYGKKVIPGGSKPYLYFETIMDYQLDKDLLQLMEYARAATKAVGIEVGPVHGEYYIDDRGPVLVEVNCRISGGNMPGPFLDRVFGHHETDRNLEAYLDKDKFNQRLRDGYKTYEKGYNKVLVCPEEMDISGAPVCDIAKQMPSFFSTYGLSRDMKGHLKRTIDLETSAGKVFLVNKDENVCWNDCKELCRLEVEEFDKLFTRE